MILGATTASWSEHLFTTDFLRLVERTRRRGASHIELYQTCMGPYEEGAEDDWRPAMDGLGRLVRTFPAITFSLAIPYSFLTVAANPASPQFLAALEAARVAGPISPTLRVMDATTSGSRWEPGDDLTSMAGGVAQLAREGARHGVRLCMESTIQPIRNMGLLLAAARKSLPSEEARHVGLCIDPVSSMESDPGHDPIKEIGALTREHIFMLRLRQTRNGRPHPTVGEGDLDYVRLVQALKSKGYDGPAILDIPAGEQVFDNFKESVDYVERLMGSG